MTSGDAQARPLDQKPSGYDRCKETWVCLFQDSNGQGRMIRYVRYGTYGLKGRSMVGKGKGVSFVLQRSDRGARATLIFLDVPDLNLRDGVKQNVPRDWNDKALKVRLFP